MTSSNSSSVYNPYKRRESTDEVGKTLFLGAFLETESLKRLQAVFLSSPLTIDWSSVNVPIWAGLRDHLPEIAADSIGATPLSLVILNDPLTLNTELAIMLESVILRKMLLDCGHSQDYPLRLTLMSYAPSLSRTNRFFISSVSDSLAMSPPHLEFQLAFIGLNNSESKDPSFNSRTRLVG